MKTLASITAALAILSAGSTALAEDAADPGQRLTLWGSFAPTGEVIVEDSDDDLDSAYGMGLSYVKPVSEPFHLGAQLSFLSWLADGNGNDDRDRNLLINLGLRPEGVFDINESVSLFGAGIIGLTYSSIGEDEFLGGEIEDALGFYYGIGGGARFALKGGGGIQVELSLQKHEAEHEVDTLIGDADFDASLEVALLKLGYFFN